MVVVRNPRRSDAGGLAHAWEDMRAYYAALDEKAFQDADPNDVGLGRWLLEALERADAQEDRLVRVADVSGEAAVGFVEASIEAAADAAERQLMRDLGRTRVTIDALAVQRAYWRRGIGRALAEAVEAWAAQRGAEFVKTTTYSSSPVSVPFYEALGFHRRATVLIKYLPPKG